MKIGLVICTYNRPEYLKQTIAALKKADLSKIHKFIIVDDASDVWLGDILNEIEFDELIRNDKRSSIRKSLLTGFDSLFESGCDVVINLDSDALVRNDFVDVLISLHDRFSTQIITGFNCNTLSLHGNVRHKILEEGDGYNIKASVGGINMCFDYDVYKEHVRPALVKTLKEGGNWDHEATKNTTGVICAVPSVIQHIGFESSMGHTGIEPPDTADDFKILGLPTVTLIGIDCKNIERLLKAFDASMKNIAFGAIKILSSISHERVTDIIKPLTSKEAYSEFCIKDLYKYVDTEFMLVIQYDGYVVNANAWDNDFYKYDYIGAPWEWLKERQVGNGGFSFRSRKLMDFVSCIPKMKTYHPEDDVICHTYGEILERGGFKFAPVELARKFSIEGYKADKRYRGQFGFHGTEVQFTDNLKKAVILQPFGLGDVIFCQTLANQFKGYDIIWPVKDVFVEGLNRAYPNIKFIPEKESPVALTYKKDSLVDGHRVIPIRFSDSLQRTPYSRVMRAKYDMYKLDWRTWRDCAMWTRDLEKENRLFNLLGLIDGDEYAVKNLTFGCDFAGKINIPDTGLKEIEIRLIEGFSLFDWYKVLVNASEIHTVSTSIMYMLAIMPTTAVNVYIRRPNEKNHNNYQYIFHDSKFIYK